MIILGVDLAPTRSGVCRLVGGEVESVWTSKGMSTQYFLTALERDMSGAHVICEDLPPHIPNNEIMKFAYRMQGRVQDRFEARSMTKCNSPLSLTWLQPMYWQRHHGVFKASTQEIIDKGTELGLRAPEVRTDKKSLEDRASSYLIARWALDMFADHGTLEVRGVREHVSLTSEPV